jgi:RHS repeat-associated protein
MMKNAAICAVNANARLYDPQVGRFLSADPTTETPYDLQDLNRYSYCLNNPLSLTDPTGIRLRPFGIVKHRG